MARAPGPATLETVMRCPPFAAVDLYWIPLGAGGHSVRLNGKVYETLDAARRHRSRCDLYHTALVVELDGDRYTIELAPSPDGRGSSRGVVATGPVGTRRAGRWRLFRYEVRRWHGGSIPDLDEAVGGPCRLSRDLEPPPHGRAPGWDAGFKVARRDARVAGFHGGRVRSDRARVGWRCRMAEVFPAGRIGIDLNHSQQGGVMSKFFKYGGLVASIVLIAFGIGAVYTGIDGRDRVQSDLAREQIVGTPDSTIPN